MSVVRRDGSPEPQHSEGWGPYLDRGEKILWEGSPNAGLRARAGDIGKSVFGIFFFGFALFWMWGASGAMSAPGEMALFGMIFPLFGLPFVAVGAYMLFGQYFWNAHVRRNTRYALTDKRAIIAKSVWRRTLNSYKIEPSTQVEFQPGAEASIWFAEEVKRGSKGRRYTVKKGFEYIQDGDEVYRLIRRIQQGEAV